MKLIYKFLISTFILLMYAPIGKAMDEIEPPRKSPEQKLAELKAEENEKVRQLRGLGAIEKVEELGYTRRKPASQRPGETLDEYRMRLEELKEKRQQYAKPTTAIGRLRLKTQTTQLLDDLKRIQAQKKDYEQRYGIK